MAHEPTPSILGAWRITQRLDAGVDDREPDDDDKFLWFLPESIVTGDRWAAWGMPYVATGGPNAGRIDITRNDLNNPWLQRGIFSVANGILKLCMAGHESDERPNEFTSTPSNNHLMYVASRCDEPVPM